jgi:hypothetical protein
VRVGRKEHDVALFESMPFVDCFHNLVMEFTGKDVDIGADQDATMPQLVFDRKGPGPEVDRNTLCRPVPMPVSSQPSKLLGRDLRFRGSCSEVCREAVFKHARPSYQDNQRCRSAERGYYPHLRSLEFVKFLEIDTRPASGAQLNSQRRMEKRKLLFGGRRIA